MNKIISKGLLYCHERGGGGLEMDMVEEGIVYFHHTQGYQRLYIGFYENHLYNISIKTLI
jgi:hypothetical protein